MIQELMSLEAIETWLHDVNNLNGDYYRMEILHVKEMLKTARAAHELQAEVETISQALRDAEANCANCLNRLRQEIETVRAELWEAQKTIADNNFAELMKINVLAELAKARAEERERCAKVCEQRTSYMDPHCKECVQNCTEIIRALEDAE